MGVFVCVPKDCAERFKFINGLEELDGRAEEYIDDKCILFVTEAQLWIIDKFFMIPLYERKGEDIVFKGKSEKVYVYQKSSFWENASFYDKDVFNKMQENSDIKMCDYHLMIPCSLENFDESFLKVEESELAKQFFCSLTERNKFEFRSEFVKCLDRSLIGYYPIYADLGGKRYPQICMASLTKHEITNLGIVTLSLISPAFPCHHTLTDFCANVLCIENEEQSVEEWLSKMGIKPYGSARSVIFSYEELTDKIILNALVLEARPSGDICGSGFVKKLDENLAQYNTAQVYASETCLIEVVKNCPTDMFDRITGQTVELFFIELLLLQDAAVSKMNSKIISQLNKESMGSGTANSSILEELVVESAQSILFFNLNEFLFPTVRMSAENVAKCFGIDRVMANHEKYTKILEQLISMQEQKYERIENASMNALLLILSFGQALPIFMSAYNALISGSFSVKDFGVTFLSVASCFSLWLFYKLSVKIRVRRKTRKETKKRDRK